MTTANPETITKEEREARWRGLGDVIASATKAVGIQPCPKCKQRQATLNKLVPFNPITGQHAAPPDSP